MVDWNSKPYLESFLLLSVESFSTLCFELFVQHTTLNVRKKAFFNVWWRTQPHSISEWIRWDPLIYPSFPPPPPPSFLCTWLPVVDDLKTFQASSICRFFLKWVMDKAKNTLDLQGCDAMRDWREHTCDFASHIATGEEG